MKIDMSKTDNFIGFIVQTKDQPKVIADNANYAYIDGEYIHLYKVAYRDAYNASLRRTMPVANQVWVRSFRNIVSIESLIRDDAQ